MRVSLASSSELREDRDEFDLYFCQQNDFASQPRHFPDGRKGEHFLDAMSATRPQHEYNQAIRECDVFCQPVQQDRQVH
jgi:hypothetical protein